MKLYIKCDTNIEELAKGEFGFNSPGYGCSYISPDGMFINIYPELDTHEDLCWFVQDVLNTELEYNDEEYFIREFNWLRLRTDPYIVIIELPASITSSQLDSLKKWLWFAEERYNRPVKLYLDAVDSDDGSVEYDFKGEYFSEDILKICERYYRTHKLY